MPDENPVDLIFAQLLANQRVVKSVLRAMCPLFSDQEFGLALHAAQERIRDEHQIVFVPTPGRAGVLVRATAAQKINRRIARPFFKVRSKSCGMQLCDRNRQCRCGPPPLRSVKFHECLVEAPNTRAESK